MKAILEFDLKELRRRTKYASDDEDEKVVEALYKFRETVGEIMSKYNVNFE